MRLARPRLGLVATIGLTPLLLTGAVLAPAHADGTPVQVSLSAPGGLTISQPTSTATLTGSSTAGSALSGSLGDTTVTDDRGTLLGWTVTATTSGDLVSVNDASKTISLGTLPAGGPLTVSVPTVSALAGALLTGVAPGAGGSLNPSSPVTLAAALPLRGSGSYTFTPGLSFTVPPNTFADTYRTVITQTVA